MPTFDQLAQDYDLSFSHTILGQYYRHRVQHKMQQYWPGKQHILEINAGTGEDAIYLANLGNRVLATDIAPAMLLQLNKKAKQQKKSALITTQTLAVEQLNSLQGQTFDGLLSNFGGLNCVEDLELFVNTADNLLKHKGIMILVIMGPWVPWEMAYYVSHGQFNKAFRRFSGNTHWRGINIYYPKLTTVKQQLDQHFKLLHQEGLGVLMPPSYINNTVMRWPKLFNTLAKIEDRLAHCSTLAHLADHYLLVYQKSEPVNE